MSGTFNDIDVPPTLVSFAVDIAKNGDIVTPELKQAGNKLVRFKIEKDEFDIPKYDAVAELYSFIHQLMQKKADGIRLCAGSNRRGSSHFQDGIR